MIELTPIGYLRSPYKEKFAIPRQPGLVDHSMTVELVAPFNHPDCIRDLAQFSHLWLLFIFHQTAAQGWRPLVRPPRLGGNRKTGIFATRSTFRPNPLGQSLVRLQGIEQHDGVKLFVQGADLVDGTPIVDIKPYLPWAEAIPDAKAGFAQQQPEAPLTVVFGEQAQAQCQQYAKNYPRLAMLIEQTLAQDPRPAYRRQSTDERCYGVTLYDLNIRFTVEATTATVIAITTIGDA